MTNKPPVAAPVLHPDHPESRRPSTHPTPLRSHSTGWWGFATAGVAVLMLTSCSSGDDEDEQTTDQKPSASATDSSSPSPSASPADPQAAEKDKVLAVYGHHWAEQVKAYAKADDKGTDVEKYTTADALAEVLGNVMTLEQAGTRMTGQPRIAPEVTSLSLEAKTPKAQITDCFDITDWQTVNDKSGKQLKRPEQQLNQYVLVATAEKWEDAWLITKVAPQDRRCEPAASSSPRPPS